MAKDVRDAIRSGGLLKAGDRVGAAVSGGADSVALLRALVELRGDLGIVVSVLHFHHGIRGDAADKDEAFVAELAQKFGLECAIGRGNVPTHAKVSAQSLETAARELRYRFFESVLRSGGADKIATAHTMDDQAETVLMRTLRGAGTRGVSGILAEKHGGRFIRPMLNLRRHDVEAYLEPLGQAWREDESNLERRHFRNHVRHDLIPLLEKDYNPNVVEVLARSAEIARGEEEYWQGELARLLPLVKLPGKPTRGGGRSASGAGSLAFDLAALERYAVAVQRRLLLAALRESNIAATAEHVEALLQLARRKGPALNLPGGWRALRSLRELRLEESAPENGAAKGYIHELNVPGEAWVGEINLLVQTRLEQVPEEREGYNSGEVPGELRLNRDSLSIQVRNWREGDRFWPGQSKTEKKVKDILKELKIPAHARKTWPVVVAGQELIWVRGARQRPVRVEHQGKQWRLVIAAEEMRRKQQSNLRQTLGRP